MKNWNILNNFKLEKLITLLLENRGIKTKKEREDFLKPTLENVTVENVGINKKQLTKAIKRIEKAIKNNEQIIVFGDYDVDGITGSAILWETIHSFYKNVLPYIPHREEEGYGLSIPGIESIKNQISKIKNVSLIITVDNGIVAHEAVDYANKNGIDVIITDHHVAPEILPAAHAIVHTTKLCGAGVAYLLAQKLITKNQEPGTKDDDHLELAALGTIADLVPLTGANRAIVKHGLVKLSQTKRPGLTALFKKAGIDNKTLTPYEVGFIIGPRLNAAGRIESAMDSLRLICTQDPSRAEILADKLELINRQRQQILKDSAEHAISEVRSQKSLQSGGQAEVRNLLFIAHETYQQGVIGLIAGKLVEEFYRPSIVLSIGAMYTKASARSVAGFNIIEFLRAHTEHFINVGGHPMAAGFTIETAKLTLLQNALEKSADELITEAILQRSLRIDCELPLEIVDTELFNQIQALAPFGMGNPEPTFASYGVTVNDFKLLGKDRNHLKLELGIMNKELRITAIGFGLGEFAQKLKPGDKIDIAYAIDENIWNGNTNLQLKIKDIKTND